MEKKRKEPEWFNFNSAIVLITIIALFIILRTTFTPSETVELLEDAKSELVKEAEIVLNTLSDRNAEVSLLESNELIEEKIRDFDERGYNEVKDILGVENDFCIFFEDSSGNLVKIDGINPYIGSNKIYINGYPCK